jgi:hypothetical protein
VSPADGPIVVWHLRGALLALPLDAVEEIVAIGEDGRARGRAGELEVTAPPGLGSEEGARWGVVLRAPRRAARGVALGADQVEGVMAGGDEVDGGLEWLGVLDLRHLKALLRLEDGRLAALLDLDSLFTGP